MITTFNGKMMGGLGEREREVFTTKYDAKVNRTLKSNFLSVILLLIKVFPLKLETN